MSTALKTETVGFWEVLNPPIYLVSLLPGLVVIQWNHHPLGIGLGMGIAAVILLQHGINVMNDRVDGLRGADGEKRESWMKYQGDETHVGFHGGLALVLGLLMGVLALWHTGNLGSFVFLGPLALLGIAYNTGERPLSYGKLGEWVTAICYGPGVFIGYWILSGQRIPTLSVFTGSIGCGAIAVSCLLSHQPKQILTDAAVGKNSFAVRHGARATIIWSRATLLLFFFCIGVGSIGLKPLGALTACLTTLSLLSLRVAVKPKNQLLLGLAGAVLGLIC